MHKIAALPSGVRTGVITDAKGFKRFVGMDSHPEAKELSPALYGGFLRDTRQMEKGEFETEAWPGIVNDGTVERFIIRLSDEDRRRFKKHADDVIEKHKYPSVLANYASFSPEGDTCRLYLPGDTVPTLLIEEEEK